MLSRHVNRWLAATIIGVMVFLTVSSPAPALAMSSGDHSRTHPFAGRLCLRNGCGRLFVL